MLPELFPSMLQAFALLASWDMRLENFALLYCTYDPTTGQASFYYHKPLQAMTISHDLDQAESQLQFNIL